MNKRHLDDEWKGWLQHNIDRRCDPEELLGILLKNNFSVTSIRESMGMHFPAQSFLLNEAGEPIETNYAAIAAVKMTRPDGELKAQQVLTKKLQLYTVDNFLSDKECDAVVRLMRKHLRPSTITVKSPDKYFRTSSTCDLSLLKSKFVKDLDKKIAEAIGIRLAYSEGIQAQHYEVGQEFKKHTDFFEPGTKEYMENASRTGNRTWTFMIYLNTVPKGGETKFFNIDYAIAAEKGKAVIWNNLYPDGCVNYDTLHAGLPVKEGHKDIVTKWFREKGAGSMF